MDDCLFCKSPAVRFPTELVYADDRVVAFDDINPQAPVHTLIIPRDSLHEHQRRDSRRGTGRHLRAVPARRADQGSGHERLSRDRQQRSRRESDGASICTFT